MQTLYEEKRKDSRLNISMPLRYQIRGTQESGNAVTKNLGPGGLSFIVEKFIKPETHIALDVNVFSKNINSIGTVRWAGSLPHSDRYQLGLEFVGLTLQDKKFISDYIKLRSHQENT